MPDVHGNITAGDLAQGLVQDYHLRDDAVTTPKIAAQAVTVTEQSDPVFVAVVEDEDGLADTPLDGTPQPVASVSITVPSWVDTLYVLAFAVTQMTNTSGGDNLLLVSARIGGLDDGLFAQEIPSPSTGQCFHIEERTITAPGSTVEVANYAWLAGNKTNGSNQNAVWAIALGTR